MAWHSLPGCGTGPAEPSAGTALNWQQVITKVPSHLPGSFRRRDHGQDEGHGWSRWWFSWVTLASDCLEMESFRTSMSWSLAVEVLVSRSQGWAANSRRGLWLRIAELQKFPSNWVDLNLRWKRQRTSSWATYPTQPSWKKWGTLHGLLTVQHLGNR